MAEVHRDPKKRAEPFKATEFLPWVERAVTMTPRAFRAQFAGRIKQKTRGK